MLKRKVKRTHKIIISKISFVPIIMFICSCGGKKKMNIVVLTLISQSYRCFTVLAALRRSLFIEMNFIQIPTY